MDLQLLFASAVTPSLLLLWYFHSRDHHPEPRGVLLATFLFGVAIVVPVFLIATPLDLITPTIADPGLRGVYRAFAVAAIPEELLKFCVVWFYCARHRAFDEPMDGLVYGAVASLGFATLENVLYVAQGGLELAVMRAVTAVPSHAFWGVIMGLYIGQAKFGPPALRARRLFAAWFFPMLLHGLYDAPVLALNQSAEFAAMTATEIPDAIVGALIVSLVTLVVSGVWAYRAAFGMRRDQLSSAPVGADGLHLPIPVPATSWLGVILLLIGGALVTAGGFFALGVGYAAAGYADKPVEVAALAVSAVVVAVPLVLGLITFRAGLRRI
jgi:RsiW-degrading membrane proteinase PrsW (M82 family)